MYYTGIGSRETPEEILIYFDSLAKFLAKKGLILRSGGANGADKSFEAGCDKVNGLKEIFIPWNGFNNSSSRLVVTKEAFEIAQKFHPMWYSLKQSVKKLHARNVHQILGYDLNTPTSFIVCYTKNGSGMGGTGQALRIAKNYNIPVFDAGKYSDVVTIKKELKLFLISIGAFTVEELTK